MGFVQDCYLASWQTKVRPYCLILTGWLNINFKPYIYAYLYTAILFKFLVFNFLDKHFYD